VDNNKTLCYNTVYKTKVSCSVRSRELLRCADSGKKRGLIHVGEFFEAGMVICFGLSWPVSVMKSWHARTAKGKSIVFGIFVLMGYSLAIAGKLFTHNITYVFFFYILNWIMVSIDMLLYHRNRRLDLMAEREAAEPSA